MLQHGLQPDLSPAAVAETAAITRAATEASGSIRDLRGLLWASIDNDDSRDSTSSRSRSRARAAR